MQPPRKRSVPPPATALIRAADAYATGLLKSTTSGTKADGTADPGAAFDTQVDVLMAVTKYLAVRDKVTPEPDADNDFLSAARRRLEGGDPTAQANGGAPKRRSRRSKNLAIFPQAASDSTDITERAGPALPNGFERGERAGAISNPDDASTEAGPQETDA